MAGENTVARVNIASLPPLKRIGQKGCRTAQERRPASDRQRSLIMSTTDTSIGVTCSNCGHETEKTLGWLREHTHFICAGCQHTVEFDGLALADEVQREIEKAQLDLNRTVKQLNRRLKL